MAKDIGEQVMQELLRALSRDGVKNSAKMNYGLNLLARYRAETDEDRREAGKSALLLSINCIAVGFGATG